ncbi:MAG: hypothetical protein C0618_02600 [Desulfuromonas sp.]|nr:MAG: hypothetical protein C0618_02600 [Desulfuromonas sp.]
MHKIVVHPGSAHRDDFLSAAVLLSILESAEVFRREPTADDLADLNTYVLDVGMIHDPSRHNFDHHQDSSLPCAFHLLMQHLGYHEDALKIFGWYGHMSMMDVRGPYKTAEHLGIDSNVLFAASSPLDGYILSRFSRVTELLSGDPLHALMKDLGHELIELIASKKERLQRLRTESELVPLQGRYKALVSRIAQNPKLAMEIYLREMQDVDVVMSITPSVRGAGWELLRLGDHPAVDFRRLPEHEDIRFVHANGFIAKTWTLLPLEKVVPLAVTAVVADAGGT